MSQFSGSSIGSYNTGNPHLYGDYNKYREFEEYYRRYGYYPNKAYDNNYAPLPPIPYPKITYFPVTEEQEVITLKNKKLLLLNEI